MWVERRERNSEAERPEMRQSRRRFRSIFWPWEFRNLR